MPNSNKMTFHLRDNGGNIAGAEWIAAEGEIARETAADLEAFVRGFGYTENPGAWSVRFNSPGGDLAGGIQLGETIRRLKLDTEIGDTDPDGHHWRRAPGRCASAASFAFLGGVNRNASGDELGVHQFYQEIALRNPTAKVFSALDFSNQQLVSAILIDYAFRMGVDPRFVSLAAATPPGDMLFLDEQALNELNVRWFPKELGRWSIEPHGAGVIAVTSSKDRTRKVTFAHLGGSNSKLTVEDIAPSYIDADWVREAVTAVESVIAFDQHISTDALKANLANGVLRIEFLLSNITGDAMAASRWSAVGVDGPRYMWGAFTYEIPRDNVGAAISVCLRNPI